MVQRKMPNKLGIQAENYISEKLMANFKPSSFQHHDIKNKGPDLKKKMKKSGSFKRSEAEKFCSPNVKSQLKQPGKPPPATPKKVSPIKAMMDSTPHYMKSTTSSDARKERGQFSSPSPQNSSDRNSSIRRNSLNSKNSPGSGNKAVRALSRTTSLKLMRTLTKAPSFKPQRASAKQCSPIILCENLNVQRATCSSTIKDQKFAAYLTLSPGATEAEGTSAMKVCPYTYCSLNGHHHDPLPPLKSFLSARRRMLKAQRSIKLGCLSPRRSKPVQDIIKESGDEERNTDEKLPFEYADCLNELEVERKPSIQSEVADSETSDMDWEAGLYSDPCIDGGGANCMKINDLIDLGKAHSSFDNALFDEVMQKSDEAVGNDCEENLQDEIVQESIDDATEFEQWFGDDDSESTGSYQNTGSKKSITYDDQSYKGLAADELIAMEEEDDSEKTGDHVEAMADVGSATLEKLIKKASVTSEDMEGGSEPSVVSSSIGPEVGFGIDYIIKTQDDYASKEMRIQESEDSHEIGCQEFENSHGTPKKMIEEIKNSNGTQTEIELEDPRDMCAKLDEVIKSSIGTQTDFDDDQLDAVIEPSCLNDGSLIPKSKVPQADTCFEMELLTTDSMNGDEGKENIEASVPYIGIQNFTLLHDSDEAVEQVVSGDIGNQLGASVKDDKLNQPAFNDQRSVIQSVSSHNDLDSLEDESQEAADSYQAIQKTQLDSPKDASCIGIKYEEQKKAFGTSKGTNRVIDENKELTEFNPRAPNFLSVEPDPEAEKVDLRHLTMDEKKNAEEWMVDYALRQAVTKLAPARKRKVALLVEAFETVLPIPKCETRLRHSPSPFSQVRTIQACS